MPQYSLEHTVIVSSKPVTKEDLKEVFLRDNDFIENEDYFREDTLDLGYEDEGERVADEIFKEDLTDKEKIEACFKRMFDSDSSYYSEYDIDITEVGDKYVTSAAYLTRT